jgi:hypothetical protein
MFEKPKRNAPENAPADRSSIELAYASLVMYADDGKLDEKELTTLLHIATRDGKINEREKDILRALFNRIHEEDVSADVWNHIQAVRKQHAI